MRTQKVAGTVMLHLSNGETRFLMIETDAQKQVKFATAEVKETQTNLSSILAVMKNEAKIATLNLDLLDFTKVTVAEQKIPFFVFEWSIDTNQLPQTDKNYYWALPAEFRKNVEGIDVAGVPVFC